MRTSHQNQLRASLRPRASKTPLNLTPENSNNGKPCIPCSFIRPVIFSFISPVFG